MRRIRYQVAASLDGYIAGPNGEYDWIVMDPEIDFATMMARFDTYLMGRRTYEMMAAGGGGTKRGVDVWVFSRTLRPEDHPGVTVVADAIEERLRELRSRPGKDIWLFGGGALFRSLLELGQVDDVEVAVMPVLLGGGIPLLPAPAARRMLSLTGHRVYAKTGTVLLEYAVRPPERSTGRARGRRGAKPASIPVG
jgi:dihydrofolate reductase